jgi:hypothetical protein
MHGGPSPGAPKGNRNAFKHGRYTAEAIARRREISALIRVTRSSRQVGCELDGNRWGQTDSLSIAVRRFNANHSRAEKPLA